MKKILLAILLVPTLCKADLLCNNIRGIGTSNSFQSDPSLDLKDFIAVDRYKVTEVLFDVDGVSVKDIKLSGPFDKDTSYLKLGYDIQTTQLSNSRLLVIARNFNKDFSTEEVMILDVITKTLIWSQMIDLTNFDKSAAQILKGECVVK